MGPTAYKRRVMFVDDEPSLLASLRTVLRRERNRWDMVFVGDAKEALAELQRARVDMIVSDMRMPGMDGAQLLCQVRRQYPEIVRVMLTGQADRDAIVRALPALHRLLSK